MKTQVVVLSSLLACAALIAIAVWARGSQTHAPSSRIPEPLVSNPTREEDAKSELEAARRERERLLGRVAGLEAELRTLREKADAKAEPRAGEGTEPPPVAIQNAMRSWAALIADPERVWDHLHNTGDIESMEEFTRTVGTLVPWKLENEEVSGDERAKLERLLDLNGFRQGYVKFAKGDLAAAEEALEAHIERLDEKEATLAADGLKLDPAAMVYREMRSKDVLRFLRERAERLPALELDLGEGWIGEKRVLLGESRGKVVAVLFRRAGDARAGAFLAGLSREFAGKAGASLVTIGWFRTEDNIEEARAKLREDLAAIGYEGPAGVDPDPSGHSLFRGWQATVGSASFMIVDREGRLAWYMTDPKSSDLAIVSRILDRVEGRR